MKIQTFSIVAGTSVCDARCPFCVSKMTPEAGVKPQKTPINIPNFRIACLLAKQAGVTTAMITGKGEPALFPEDITTYLWELEKTGIPILELQTNGISLAQDRIDERGLREWYISNLRVIMISVVDCDPEKNRQIYMPYAREYIDLPALIEKLHGLGFSVRLSVTMMRDYIDSPHGVDRMIAFAKEHKVEQLSMRPVRRPEVDGRSEEVYNWITPRLLGDAYIMVIRDHLDRLGTKLMTLMHGAVVYDVMDQNVCLTDCLTRGPLSEDLRQIIYFPDGHIRYDWQYPGAIII